MHVGVRSQVFPTEDENRILSALTNFFPGKDTKYRFENCVVSMNTDRKESLELVRNAIHSSRIIDTVRSSILRNLIGLETRILVDKQAAYYGKLRLVDDREEEPPLGSIWISISFADDEELEAFLKWFVPPTKNGRIVLD